MDLQLVKNKYRIIGKDTNLDFALQVALQAAKTDLSVLIIGESGVGKEVFSKIIHSNSARRHNPFIAINCGALPEGTINSELFGHEKGSFTGATDTRKGYFETTNEGTIFLDEIGELPLGTQARLLRLLESGEYLRVGSSEVRKTNVRIIAATNKSLLQLIDNGSFREDLYYRLSTIPIRVPSLRERGNDIFLLFRFFANEFAEKYHATPIQLDEKAKEKILAYHFPGNIRELKNIVERMSVLSESRELISVEDMNKILFMEHFDTLPTLYKPSIQNATTSTSLQVQQSLERMVLELRKEVTELQKAFLKIIKEGGLEEHIWQTENTEFHTPIHTTPKQLPALIDTKSPQKPILLEENLNLIEKEKEFIIKALRKHKGRRKDAAEELGISRRTLFRKIKDYNLE